MGKKGFKDLMVWQQAKDLAVIVYRLSDVRALKAKIVSFRQACIAERNLPGVRLGGKRSPVLPVVAP